MGRPRREAEESDDQEELDGRSRKGKGGEGMMDAHKSVGSVVDLSVEVTR